MKHIVGIGEMKISSTPGDTLVTYALGSCLGVTLYDPEIRLAGMVHLMLPTLSQGKREVSGGPPCLHVDTGLVRLFQSAFGLGASRDRFKIKVAGGSGLRSRSGKIFQIGERNLAVLRQMFAKSNLKFEAEDTGGHEARTMTLEVSTGRVLISMLGETRELCAPTVRLESRSIYPLSESP